jgi:hypothetical protein
MKPPGPALVPAGAPQRGQACRAVQPRRGRPQDGPTDRAAGCGVRSAAKTGRNPKLQGARGWITAQHWTTTQRLPVHEKGSDEDPRASAGAAGAPQRRAGLSSSSAPQGSAQDGADGSSRRSGVRSAAKVGRQARSCRAQGRITGQHWTTQQRLTVHRKNESDEAIGSAPVPQAPPQRGAALSSSSAPQGSAPGRGRRIEPQERRSIRREDSPSARSCRAQGRITGQHWTTQQRAASTRKGLG